MFVVEGGAGRDCVAGRRVEAGIEGLVDLARSGCRPEIDEVARCFDESLE